MIDISAESLLTFADAVGICFGVGAAAKRTHHRSGAGRPVVTRFTTRGQSRRRYRLHFAQRFPDYLKELANEDFRAVAVLSVSSVLRVQPSPCLRKD